MNQPTCVLVLGATGNVGGAVVAQLAGLPVHVRAGVRNVAETPAAAANTEYVPFDFDHPTTYDAALTGVDTLFLVRPPALADAKRFFNPVIDRAKALGVGHVVFLSLIGVEGNKLVPHYAIEQYIMRSGLPYTFLRAGFFMQNLTDTHRAEIRDHDELFIPAGRGKTAFIDTRDIAAVGVKAILEGAPHYQQAYRLTGSESLDYYEVAALLTRELGRPITYRDPNVLRFVARMLQNKQPFSFALITSAIYLTTRFGKAAEITPDVAQLLGRPPTLLATFMHDYRAQWMPNPAR